MMTEDPDRRGVAVKARAPRNRDPREAEAGPRVMSGLVFRAGPGTPGAGQARVAVGKSWRAPRRADRPVSRAGGYRRRHHRHRRRDHHAGRVSGAARSRHPTAGRERHELRGDAGQRAGLGQPCCPRHHRSGRYHPPVAAGVHHDVGGGRGSAGRHAGRGFRPVVPFLVAAGSLILLMQPRISKWQEDNEHAWGPAAVSGVLGAVSLYNGYFGAGSGILLIGLLLLTTEPVLHRANAIKNVLLAASDILPAVLFASMGTVVWTAAIPLGTGTIAGGLIGPSIARRAHHGILRVLIACTGFALAGWLIISS